MDMKLATASQLACHMRLPGCIAPPHSQLLCAGRQHSPAMCHAVSASQPSTPARIDVLTQQYQGLLAPAKPKPANSSTAGKKLTQSSKTSKQKGDSSGSNVGSRVSGSAERASSSDSPAAATQHSRRARSAAPAGRNPKQTHSKAATSNTSSTSSSSNKVSRDSQAKNKLSNSSNRKKASKQTATNAPAQSVILSGKGFGTAAAAPPSSSSSNNPSSSSSSNNPSSSSINNTSSSSSYNPSSTSNPTSSSSYPSSRSSKTLKLFRFGVEAAAIQKVIQQNGWEDRVEQVEQLSQADVLVAVKCTPGGRHQNLQQGERAAANAKIPFIVIGRRLSKEQFYKALSPHLGLQTPDERAAEAEEATQAAHDQAFADQWFKTASQIKWGSAVPAAATNATAALQQRSRQQTVAAQVQVHKQQQQVAASGRDTRSSSNSRGATR